MARTPDSRDPIAETVTAWQRRAGSRPLAVLAALVVAGTATLAPPASAQEPKPGDYYEDVSKYGFKVKVPKKWTYVPPQPNETSLFGKFDPPNSLSVSIGREENVWLHGWLVQFDRRPKPEPEIQYDEDGEVIVINIERDYRDIEDWIKNGGHVYGNGWQEIQDEREDLRTKDKNVVATRHVFTAFGGSADRPEIRAYAAVYKIDDDIDLALVFNGPGEDKGWRKYERAFESMAETFQRVEVEELDLDRLGFVADGSPRAQRKALLLDEMRRQPGWELYETENYLIISHNNDKKFMEELMERIEKIRAIFVEDYPPEKARRVANDDKQPGPQPDARGEKGEKPEGDEEDDGDRSVSVQADPFEKARASVLRVCKDRAEYVSYGGPSGSAGYWYSVTEELVIYDDKAGRGQDFTWLVMNHEAFHQYIYYFYGEIAPHSWYNEGTGDFYSGFEYKYGRYKEKPAQGRLISVMEMLREERYVPLEELVRYSQSDYYSSTSHGTDPVENYALGWSLVYFLRTGKEQSRDWNDAWDHILDTYLETLAETTDLDRSIDVAFAGVDWKKLESAWKTFYLKDL